MADARAASPPAGWRLTPRWSAPDNVKVVQTTRLGGVSAGRYATLNLGLHVGDDPSAVAENRRRVQVWAGLPAIPAWLEQVHGRNAVSVPAPGSADARAFAATPPRADAAVARAPGRVAAILTADCLPVVFTTRGGDRVAIAHGGWRGLTAGVLEHTVAALDTAAADLLAWIGPGIGARAYRIGDDVAAAVRRRHPDAEAAILRANPSQGGGLRLDLERYAEGVLLGLGVAEVMRCGLCTASEPARFFSHRRDGTTGRMATLAWFE